MFPDNPALKRVYDAMGQEYAGGYGEITIPIRKLPAQGYTRLKTTPDESELYHPWRALDDVSSFSGSSIKRRAAGAPASQISQRVLEFIQTLNDDPD